MENAQIADLFQEIADILLIRGESQFRVRSYQNAARVVRDMAERLADMVAEGRDLKQLPGVGKSIAEQIGEIVYRGTSSRLEELRGQLPESLLALLRVRGLGPKKVKALHDALGINSLDELEQACKDHRVRNLPGMGAKTEEKILDNLERARANIGRMLLRDADAIYERFAGFLESISPAIQRFVSAGSRRRRRETVGDLDILVCANDRAEATRAILSYDAITGVEGQGEKKLTLVLNNRLNVDVRFFEEESFGAAMLYFTGSKDHNIEMRKVAIDQGFSLNEYGLNQGGERIVGATEEAIYDALGMPWVPPEMRENRGEVQAARQGKLPHLIDSEEICGDLHCHTTETDGKHSIREMAQAARDRGYAYLAITDHTKAVAIANGMDEDRLRAHADRIREENERYDDLWLMTGVEVDILKDGRLDIEPALLDELDWVIASVHSYFDLDEKAMTARLVAAIGSGVVDCIGHPLTRQLGVRDKIAIDVDAVFEACRDQGVALELNAQPERLDLPDIYCHRARDLGVPVAIATDAHRVNGLQSMRYGIDTARRGWLEPRHVVNSLAAEALAQRLARTGAARWQDRIEPPASR
jgi:DNA polymerase (family 10)